MTKAWLVLAVSCARAPLSAQNIAGTWQGAITFADGRQFREIIEIAKTDTDWTATGYSIDQGPDGDSSISVALRGPHVTIAFRDAPTGPEGGTYDGQLDQTADAITGGWTASDGRRYSLNLKRVSRTEAWPLPPGHTARFVAVDRNVKLEVLDWGGTGPPVVFLSGLGADSHDYDPYAPKFTPRYHAYGITRRGAGASSHPLATRANYSATRLSDDVLAVLDSLHLVRPVLVGHSQAGEELSAIGSRHPERVAGLIYLDAAYTYAFYDSTEGDFFIDRGEVEKKLDRIGEPLAPRDTRASIRQLLQSDLPRLEQDLRDWLQGTERAYGRDSLAPPRVPPDSGISLAIESGEEKFTGVRCPVLAIFAANSATTEHAATIFAAGVPSARVVRLPHARHWLFRTNEADVLREMNAFLSTVFTGSAR